MATIYLVEIEEGTFLQKFGNGISKEYVSVIEVYEDSAEYTPEFLASKAREKELRKQLSAEHKVQFELKHKQNENDEDKSK